jgi:hypothetical protein
LIANDEFAIDGREQLAPGIGLRHSMPRRQSHLFHGSIGFGTASDGGDIGQGVEESLAVDMSFDDAKELSKADTRHEDDSIDATGDESVSEVDGGTLIGEWHLAQGWTHERNPFRSFNQTCDFARLATLERGYA